MSRWTPITNDDPLRVDLDQLDQQSNMYRRASLGARDVAETLTNVSDMEHWDTDTAKAFRDRAGTLARELSEVSEGMHEASYEVSMFVLRIEECERQAKRVTEEAREKHVEINAAEADADRHRDTPPATPEEEDAHQEAMWAKERRCRELRDELDAIERKFHKIVKDADDAAEYAANKLRAAASFAPELSWWDKTKHAFSEIYDDYIEPTMDGFNSYMHRVSGPLQKWCQEQTWWDGAVKWANRFGTAAAIVGGVVAVVLVAALVVGLLVAAGPLAVAATAIVGVAGKILVGCAVASLVANTANALSGDKSKWTAAGLDAAGLATLGLGTAAKTVVGRSVGKVFSGTKPHTPQYRPRQGMQFLSQLRHGDHEAAKSAYMVKRVLSRANSSGGVPPELARHVARAQAASRLQSGLAWGEHGRKGLDFIHSEKQLSREHRHVSDRTVPQHLDQTRRIFEMTAPFVAKGKRVHLKDALKTID